MLEVHTDTCEAQMRSSLEARTATSGTKPRLVAWASADDAGKVVAIPSPVPEAANNTDCAIQQLLLGDHTRDSVSNDVSAVVATLPPLRTAGLGIKPAVHPSTEAAPPTAFGTKPTDMVQQSEETWMQIAIQNSLVTRSAGGETFRTGNVVPDGLSDAGSDGSEDFEQDFDTDDDYDNAWDNGDEPTVGDVLAEQYASSRKPGSDKGRSAAAGQLTAAVVAEARVDAGMPLSAADPADGAECKADPAASGSPARLAGPEVHCADNAAHDDDTGADPGTTSTTTSRTSDVRYRRRGIDWNSSQPAHRSWMRVLTDTDAAAPAPFLSCDQVEPGHADGSADIRTRGEAGAFTGAVSPLGQDNRPARCAATKKKDAQIAKLLQEDDGDRGQGVAFLEAAATSAPEQTPRYAGCARWFPGHVCTTQGSNACPTRDSFAAAPITPPRTRPVNRPVIATCEARFDFAPRNSRDLGMLKGDTIDILEDHGGWCVARNRRGEGTVPGNYLDPPRDATTLHPFIMTHLTDDDQLIKQWLGMVRPSL